MTEKLTLFASCPKGIEDLLLQELQQLGADDASAVMAGVAFSGDLQLAYRACLWSRLASRVLLKLGEFDVATDDELYQAMSSINWSRHVSESGTLAVSCHLSHSDMTNSHYASLKAKDAVVDQFNELFGQRPSVDRERPDIRINLHIHKNRATVALDLSGEALHKRGYRSGQVKAPMKENLAAAILLRCGWPNESGKLVDLMCGSATLLIEAAMLALHAAPGLNREYFGFLNWKGHDKNLWESLLEDAGKIKHQAYAKTSLDIRGYDESAEAVKAARKNVQAAGLQKFISIEQRALADCSDPGTEQPGLVVVNPPYGERLGDVKELAYLYADLGDCWKHHFGGWSTALFTGNLELARHIGLRSHRDNTLYNGPIRCKLFHYDIRALQGDPGAAEARENEARATIANRLKKNVKHLSRWAAKNAISCYRVYDADIPEYAAAIDIYNDRVLVQEYQAPASIDIRKVRQRLRQIMEVIPESLGVDRKHIILKTRSQQKGLSQYEKQSDAGERMVVQEAGLKFYVNLQDYLDTGLFLDHRLTRAMIRDMAEHKHVLNLFAYTGSVSVYAAAGGAASTTTVDMSNTYLDWAKANFRLNDFSDNRHQFIRADCIQWLKKQQQTDARYELIFLDPPTFSNSKTMEDVFDVQKDHGLLIQSAMKLLQPDGVLVFSNNFRKFKMDPAIKESFEVNDISAATIPEDFKRNPRIHNCWTIKFR
jgi:23S rRNA (guanine2445-N2)-methyltransferase / 23S rRNA (guanine2069-N7)-methyltransferase